MKIFSLVHNDEKKPSRLKVQIDYFSSSLLNNVNTAFLSECERKAGL